MNEFLQLHNIISCILNCSQNQLLTAEWIARTNNISEPKLKAMFQSYFNCKFEAFILFTKDSFLKKKIASIEHVQKARLKSNIQLISTKFEKGKGVHIQYCFQNTKWGRCLICTIDDCICAIEIITETNAKALNTVKKKWSQASFTKKCSDYDNISDLYANSPPQSIKLLVEGTEFQCSVWQKLLEIPYGSVTTYATIAQIIGKPKASRAVGTAIGSNPIALLIPCHRVIQSSGKLGGYKWGLERKLTLIAHENFIKANS